MKSSFFFWQSTFWSGLTLILMACGSQSTSTDLDNEISVSISGTATNGGVLGQQQIALVDTTGDTLQTFWTDSLGSFSNQNSMIPTEDWNQNLYMLRSANGLQVALPTADSSGKVQILMHPLASFILEQIPQRQRAGFEKHADSLLSQLVGTGMRYSEVVRQNEFQPIQRLGAPQGPDKHPPAPIAALLYQIHTWAAQSGIDEKTLLDSLLRNQKPLLGQSDFLLGLISKSQVYGVDSLGMRKHLEGWGPEHKNLMDSIYKSSHTGPGFPELDSLSESERQLVFEALEASKFRFVGSQKEMGMGPPPESLFEELRDLNSKLPPIMIGSAKKASLLVATPDHDQRARQIMIHLGDRIGACYLNLDPLDRQANPQLSADLCGDIVQQALSQVRFEDWILRGDPTGIEALSRLADRTLLRQTMLQAIQDQSLSLQLSP